MKVQVRVEVRFVEISDCLRMRRRDMRVPHVLAYHRSIFRLHLPIVVAVPRRDLVCSISSLFSRSDTL